MKQLFLQLALVLSVVFGAALLPAQAGAINLIDNSCQGEAANTAICKGRDEDVGSLSRDVISIMLWAIGIISVIAIIVGGIRYAVSGGDPSTVKGAKETILYAVIGLVVALLAYSIVFLVLDYF